jgi:hypothetical protein
MSRTPADEASSSLLGVVTPSDSAGTTAGHEAAQRAAFCSRPVNEPGAERR